MATYHCSVKVGGKGRGAAHAAYVSREGPHAAREGLEHREHGNLPAWAQADPLEFWRAADAYERANGAVYREIEVALPRELTPMQRRDLMHEFIQTHLGDRHTYTLAIHNPTAALDGGEQPHAHLMFSERVQDERDRDPAQYFRRYNAKAPERGGCRKDSMGTREQLQDFRRSWAELTNQALARYGHRARVDHRSYRERGIEQEPEKHLGPVDARKLSLADRDALHAHRQAQRDLAHEQQALGRLDIGARLQHLTQERETRERQARQARAERERIERMTAKELAAEIQQLTPPAVDDVLSRHPEIMAARQTAWQLSRELAHTRIAAYRAQREAATWRDAHPIRAQLHNAGIKQPYLAERERIMQREQALQQEKEQAYQQAHQLADRLRPLIEAEQAPARARLAELEVLRQAKMTQEQVQERLQAARPRGAAPQSQERPQVAQKPLQTTSQPRAAPEHQERSQSAQERRQAAPPHQPLPPPILEQTAAQKPLQTAPERRQAAQERPLTAREQEKAQQLREAVETLDKRSAMLRFPELIQLYPLVAHAARLAEERLPNAEQRAAFVEGIKERGIRELAQGKTLPKPSIQPEHKFERTQEQDYGPEL